jgi:tetratricopeptide (TPR) repeat protein
MLLIFIILFNLNSKDFDLAKNYYDSGDYKSAYDIYYKLYEKEGEEFSVLFNLANTSFNLNKYGEAKAYYLKASKIKPRDSDLINNLKLTDEALNLSEKYNFTRYLSFDEIGILIYIFTFLLFVLVVSTIKRQRTYISTIRIFLLGSVLILNIFTIVLGILKHNIDTSTAVVLETLNLKTAPVANSDNISKINEGTRVYYINKEGDWIRIKADDVIGWVEEDKILKI